MPVGVRIVESVLERMGAEERVRDLVRFLVAEHLLLPDTATRRDLSDENLVLDVAAAVGSSERLAALYLLAKADAEATGPAAWTPWRRTLIHELVAKVQHVLDRGEMGTELAGELIDRVDEVRGLLSEEPDPDVDRFLRRMPRTYFLTVEPARAARHFATIAPAVGAKEVRAVHFEGVRAGTYELMVVAQDRSGLLSWIAGSLALAGMSILTAQVFTTEDGIGVDLFEVEGVWEKEVPDRRWREFRGMLRRAVDGSISLERRVDEKRRWYPAPKVLTPVTVAVDNTASDFATVIEVGAPDRLGLLYDITRTFADLELDVHLAKVATYEGRVVDSFYVRDSIGRKLTDDPERSIALCGLGWSPSRGRTAGVLAAHGSDATRSAYALDTEGTPSLRFRRFGHVPTRRRRRLTMMGRMETTRRRGTAVARRARRGVDRVRSLAGVGGDHRRPSVRARPTGPEATDGHEARCDSADPSHAADLRELGSESLDVAGSNRIFFEFNPDRSGRPDYIGEVRFRDGHLWVRPPTGEGTSSGVFGPITQRVTS